MASLLDWCVQSSDRGRMHSSSDLHWQPKQKSSEEKGGKNDNGRLHLSMSCPCYEMFLKWSPSRSTPSFLAISTCLSRKKTFIRRISRSRGNETRCAAHQRTKCLLSRPPRLIMLTISTDQVRSPTLFCCFSMKSSREKRPALISILLSR